MTKYLSLITAWVVVIAVTLGLRSAGRMRADPTDDFSFTLAHVPGLEVYHLMPEMRVTQILQDRLDLFPKSEAPKLARHLLELCKQYRFDPAFVLALIQVESAFHIKAVSPFGAVGLMQIMPATAVVTAEEMGLISKISVCGWGRAQSLRPPAGCFGTLLRTSPLAWPICPGSGTITTGFRPITWLRPIISGRPGWTSCSRKKLQPVTRTKRYFEAIRRGVPGLRFYHREA